MQDHVERPFDINKVGHIMLHEEEAFVPEQMGNIVGGAGEETVHGDHVMALLNEVIAHVRANKTCAASDQDSHRNSLALIDIAGMQHKRVCRGGPSSVCAPATEDRWNGEQQNAQIEA